MSRREREPAQLPWESALYSAVAALERRVEEAEAERERLLLVNHKLKIALADARDRLENWELRQQAWYRDQAELRRRLGDL